MLRFSTSAQNMRSSAIRELMSMATNPDMISFAGGMPNNDLFPIPEMDEIYNSLSDDVKKAGFQYGPTPGYPPLLESLKEYLKNKGLPVEDNELLITTGSLQAIYLVSKIMLDPGDTVITEYPAFIGAIAAFKSFRANLSTVPIDDDGPDLQALAGLLDSESPGAKMLYLTPYFHNPAGIIYSEQRKKDLLALMQGRDLVMIEDDPYGELYFNEADKPLTTPMKVTAPTSLPICYTSSFSKYIGPGLRLGWLLAPHEIIEKCNLAKQAVDACSPTLTQVLAHEFLARGKMNDYLARMRPIYKHRAQLMLDALDVHMPSGVTWTHPRGGFYIWVTLPEYLDSLDVLKESIDNGAVFVVGKTFDPLGQRNNCFRISFCTTPEEKIARGVEIVARAVKSRLK